MIARFSEALQHAKDWLLALPAPLPNGTTIVRDLFGKIRIAIPPGEYSATSTLPLEVLDKALGAFSPGLENLIVSGNDIISPEAIFSSKEAMPFDRTANYKILDRVISGSNWILDTFTDVAPTTKRATFYGLKGGVGRSTALSIFAAHLASIGKKVLVIDLDLESPGIGSLLSQISNYPRFGVVDWFVEGAVSQADNEVIENMICRSPVADEFPGDIFIVPAHGISENHYIEKLSRTSLSVRRAHQLDSFADRLNEMIEALERHLEPDIVLLDSRAGLHDIAAVTLSRLGATAFLFAANGAQTWQGYRLLFQHWRNHYNVVPSFRENLHIVDALVPETDRTNHRASSTEASYNLFIETIYEEIPAQTHTEAPEVDHFNFDLNDTEAPHFPIPIFWNRAFLGFSPACEGETVTQQQIAASYGDFMQIAKETMNIY
jgi:hypothetical protein